MKTGEVVSDEEYRQIIKKQFEEKQKKLAEIEKEVLKQNAEYLMASGANQQGSVVNYDTSKKQNNKFSYN